MENGFPLPLALPLSFPKTFALVTLRYRDPTRQPYVVTSPGSMKKMALQNTLICRSFQIPAGLQSGGVLHVATAAT